jgi:hypothetical protein
LTGCRIEDEVFIATGAMVFNGAGLGRARSIALCGAVHIGCQLPLGERAPIGCVAVGNPARLHSPAEVEGIRSGLTEMGRFLPYVFGVDPMAERGNQMREAMEKYTRLIWKLSDRH